MSKSSEFPRLGSSMYPFVKGHEIEQKHSLKRFSRYNKAVVPLYRLRILPLLGFGFIFLLLTTKGRKTGKMHTIPVEYRKYNGNIHIVSARGEQADWYRNIKANPGVVQIQCGFRSFQPQIEFVVADERKEMIQWYVTKYPKAAKMLFGWDKQHDKIETTDFTPLVNVIRMVKITKQSKKSKKNVFHSQ